VSGIKNPPGWDRQTLPPKDQPHAWIQWKGTQVCMSLNCPCGIQTHVDAEFAYYVRCAGCRKVYMANGHIEMVPIDPEEVPDCHIEPVEGEAHR
jgi:hypothetical protein